MLLLAAVSFLALAAVQNPPASAGGAPTPCPTATDESFARTTSAPVSIGGGPMFFAARERRYLDLLRGPEGQPLQYKRTGTRKGSDEMILDVYQITYEGLDTAAANRG